MRISIVTPTFNRARVLPAAIESVLAQNYPDIEHVIVDGLSTDETPAVVARYPHLRLIREKDRGLYDALNKGVHAATGEIIGHLNDDDVYRPGTFAAVAASFADPAVEAVSGGAEIMGNDGQVAHRLIRQKELALTVENMALGAPLPNARFFRRSFYARVGDYDIRYRVAADRDFLLRAAMAHPRAVVVEQIFYEYRAHETSLTFSQDQQTDARWREEDLSTAEHYLHDSATAASALPWLRRWHARETARFAATALRRADWKTARAAAARGLRESAAWPIALLRNLPAAWKSAP